MNIPMLDLKAEYALLKDEIEPAVCAALAVQALGPQRVFGLLLPEFDSKPESTSRGREVAHLDHGADGGRACRQRGPWT